MRSPLALNGRPAQTLWIAAIVAALAPLSYPENSAYAENQAARRAKLQDKINEALSHEIYGLNGDRRKLLEEAAELDPRNETAQWHLGKIRQGRDWLKLSDYEHAQRYDTRLKRYLARRDEAGETVADQLELARWCLKQNLDEQARAHFHAVIALAPNHREARQALGFVPIVDASGVRWMAGQDLQQLREEAAEVQKNLAAWRQKAQSYRDGLMSDRRARQDFVREQMFDISSQDAIPAMELYLSDNEVCARQWLSTLENIIGPEGSLAIARQAAQSPFPGVRQEAANLLRDRPVEEYVPDLLESMVGLTTTRTAVVNRGGRLLFRQALVRETQSEFQVMRLDTEFNGVIMPGGNGQELEAQAAQMIVQSATSRGNALNVANSAVREQNIRIAEALNTATRQELSSNPTDWWEWWNEYNEVFAGEKSIRSVVSRDEVTLVSSGPSRNELVPPSMSSPPTSTPRDCLAAGTVIWTARGAIPVEKIEVGDRVLSQHPESGELSYKPVIATTIRPSTPLISIAVGEETIVSSGGHPFWVAGEGWVRARDLISGMQIHAVDGSRTVSEVSEASAEITYNLIVADNHNYFVGNRRLLSHDNTIAEAVDTLVPGLKLPE